MNNTKYSFNPITGKMDKINDLAGYLTVSDAFQNFVTYTGALADVDLGVYGLSGGILTATNYVKTPTIADSYATTAINIADRTLIDSNGVGSVDFTNRYLRTVSGNLIMDWNAGVTYDDSYVQSLDWKLRYLSDANLQTPLS